MPASARYEWIGAPGTKVKHTFRRCDGQPLWFAGIWDRAKTTNAGEVRNFTILTVASSGWLSDYHDRAPLILEPDELGRWVMPGDDAARMPSPDRADRFEVA